MPPDAIRSAGTLVKVRISGVLTLIPGTRGFTGPGGSSPDIEVTSLDKTSGREYLVDLPEPGEPGVTMTYVPGHTVHNYLIDALYAGTLEEFEVTYSNGRGWSFFAYVKEFPDTANPGEAVGAEMKLKVNGTPTRF